MLASDFLWVLREKVIPNNIRHEVQNKLQSSLLTWFVANLFGATDVLPSAMQQVKRSPLGVGILEH